LEDFKAISATNNGGVGSYDVGGAGNSWDSVEVSVSVRVRVRFR